LVRALALAVAATLPAGPAAADGGPKVDPGWYLPFGITLGAALHPALAHGFFLGGEVSGVYFSRRALWAGGYADVLYDWGSDALRWTAGPELGWGPFGIDFGYLGQRREGAVAHGIAGRGLFTVGVVGIYGRVGWLPGAAGEERFAEVGLLIKFPALLKKAPRRPRPAAGPASPAPASGPARR
jgi:hypothetical protein